LAGAALGQGQRPAGAGPVAHVQTGLMLPHLTAQQQAQRCLCGRHLAWQVLGARTQDARYADQVCCRCWRSPDACPCTPTEQPAEGCLAIDFSDVAEPDDEEVECE
jgi:hypothetical protein